ncbi:MAG: diguanylate cyclase [Luteitalea sp.]|nr:diguanylate cyclase [Luteitalea sp.]
MFVMPFVGPLACGPAGHDCLGGGDVTDRANWPDPRSATDVLPLASSMEMTVHDSALGEQYRGRGAEANLIVIAHPDPRSLGRRYRVTPGSVLEIGRSLQTEISFPEVPSISRRHARLTYRDDVIMLADLGSRNGTYLNEEQVVEARPLQSGDRFQVGAVVFKFLHEADTENAYHEAIYELVIRDGLTNLYNRRKFQQELEREFARARRYGRALALVLFDVDHFKRINDTFGHLGGDAVLRGLARAVEELIRQEQVLARVGGEEFAVLCPETNADGARALAEKLRKVIERLAFSGSGTTSRITCSFGVAVLEDSMPHPDGLYAAADRALYLAKAGGRNHVVVADRG